MKITRERISEMIAVEVRRRLRELVEFSDGGKKKGGEGKKKPRKPSTADANDSPTKPGDVPAGPRATTGSPSVSTPEIDQDSDDDGPAVDGDQPDPVAADDPEDDEDEDKYDAVDPEGEGGEDESGAVNDEVSGKTVQAVTIEPESQVLPGAKEVVLAFNESTDVLRILVTDTGQVKFFWRNQLHDLP